MSFPRYPNYKDSGVEWLGEVPAHWDVKCLGLLCSKIGSGKTPLGGSDTYTDEGVLFIRSQNVYDEGLSFDDVVYIPVETDEEMRGSRVVRGDILLNITGASIGRTCLVPSDFAPANVNQHVCIVRLSEGAMREYVAMVLKSPAIKGQIDAAQTGAAREGLNYSQISKLIAPIPPTYEQAVIAAFLDRETAKIDTLVAEQRRLLELLSEKRQAVISHVVTKGLNPRAPTKPSGVEWLGDVPAHWSVKRFQRCVHVAEGQVDPADDAFSAMSLIAPNHVESGTGRLLALETADDQGAESGKYLCKAGDVVYSKIRPALRKVCIAPEDCLCSADMYPLRSHSGLTNAFLFWLMLSEQFSALAVLESERVAMPKINRESLKAVMFAVPPPTEQAAIVDFLTHEVTRFDELTAEAQRAIELLQERRTALISVAVTGKIDVRGLVNTEAA